MSWGEGVDVIRVARAERLGDGTSTTGGSFRFPRVERKRGFLLTAGGAASPLLKRRSFSLFFWTRRGCMLPLSRAWRFRGHRVTVRRVRDCKNNGHGTAVCLLIVKISSRERARAPQVARCTAPPTPARAVCLPLGRRATPGDFLRRSHDAPRMRRCPHRVLARELPLKLTRRLRRRSLHCERTLALRTAFQSARSRILRRLHQLQTTPSAAYRRNTDRPFERVPPPPRRPRRLDVPRFFQTSCSASPRCEICCSRTARKRTARWIRLPRHLRRLMEVPTMPIRTSKSSYPRSRWSRSPKRKAFLPSTPRVPATARATFTSRMTCGDASRVASHE